MTQQRDEQRSTRRRWLRWALPAAALALLVGIVVILFTPAPAACAAPAQAGAGARQVGFDPARVAYLEKAGWEAYYARNWPQVFGLMVQMNREEFCMPLPAAIAAAVDVVRASIAFAPPAPKNDIPTATAHLEDFYAKARQARSIQADAKTLAALEMDYWVVHRKLAIERQQAPGHEGDIEPMVQSLARLHAALFSATPAAIRRSAEMRALAAKTVDRITGGYSTDVAGDWRQIEQDLDEAYKALQ